MRLCKTTKKGNSEDFVKKAKLIFPNYDYSKVYYKNNKTHVIITCKEHGDFLRTPNVLLNKKNGCPACTKKRRWTKEIFIKESNKKHNNFYDYSKVEIKNSKSNVIIICPIHGEFEQQLAVHARVGCGCPKCANEQLESKAISNIKQLLFEYNINYTQEKTFEDCKNINLLPFDFYIESLDLLIEYDGEFHYKGWGNNYKLVESQQIRDNIKTQYAIKNHNFIRVSYKDDYLGIIEEYISKKIND